MSARITQQQLGAGSGINTDDIQENRTLGEDSTSENLRYTRNGNHSVSIQEVTNTGFIDNIENLNLILIRVTWNTSKCS